MATQAARLRKTHNGTEPWFGFQPGLWTKEVNVHDFIQQNFQPYYGDESFLVGPTKRTQAIWKKLQALFVQERKKGVLDISQIPSSITAHDAGYIDKENEIIVGLQTDAPFKAGHHANGGLRLVLSALKAYGYEADPKIVEIFSKYRRTHNDAVFDAYTAEVRRCRSSHILTGASRCVWARTHYRRLPAGSRSMASIG
jgi:formate C-acetyltransferase